MNLGLDQSVVVVTGGASGIGRAIAQTFAENGSSTVVIDCNPLARDVAAEIATAFGVRAIGIVADVADYATVQAAANETLASFGSCDHLVCAAATGSGKFGDPFWNLEPADWQRVLQVNVMGTVHAAHAFRDPLIQASDGTMLFLSSVAGQIGSVTDPPYSAAKAAVINFGQCAARDLARHGVRVNIVCPGMVKTPLNRAVWQAWNERQRDSSQKRTYEQWAAEKIERVVPLNRWQDPEDVAALAVFLASGAAKNITGQTINVDGGQVMRG